MFGETSVMVSSFDMTLYSEVAMYLEPNITYMKVIYKEQLDI